MDVNYSKKILGNQNAMSLTLWIYNKINRLLNGVLLGGNGRGYA